MNSFEELKKTITEIIDERIDKKLDELLGELLGSFPHGDCEKDNTMIKEIEKGSNSLEMSGLTAKDSNELLSNYQRGQEIFKDLISDPKTKTSFKYGMKRFNFYDFDGTHYRFLVSHGENGKHLFHRIRVYK